MKSFVPVNALRSQKYTSKMLNTFVYILTSLSEYDVSMCQLIRGAVILKIFFGISEYFTFYGMS